MDEILDLKNKHKFEELERYEPAVKKAEEKTSTGPIPVMKTWSGPQYEYSPSTRVLAGTMAILGSVALFFIFVQRNVFAAAFFLVSILMIFIISRQSSSAIEFTVGPLSVKAGPREYKFSDIKSFWIEYNPGGIKELSLQLKKWYSPYVKIPLLEEDPVQISVILLKFIPEEEHQDTILDSLSRLLGV